MGGPLPPGALPPERRAALDRRRAVPDPHPLERDAGSSDALRPLGGGAGPGALGDPGDDARRTLIGGQPRVVRVEPDPDRMAAAGRELDRALGRAPVRRRHARTRAPPCATTARCGSRRVRSSGAPRTWRRVVVGVARRPARLRARRGAGASTVPTRPRTPSSSRSGPARATAERPAGREYPAVTIALAKRPGANATAPRRARPARRSRRCARGSFPPTSTWTSRATTARRREEKSQRAGRAPPDRHPLGGGPHLAGHGLAQRASWSASRCR